MHSRRIFMLGLAAASLPGLTNPVFSQQTKPHRLVVQISSNDPALFNLVLNNVANVSKHYNDLAQEVEVEIVAYGPGLHMLREDTSPVKDRLASFSKSMPNAVFTACGNTMDVMKKAEGKDIPVMSFAKVTATGVARIMELQENGWSYVRP